MSPEKNLRPARSHGLLMELIVVCGFFMGAACLFLLAFVKADQLSALSRDTSSAISAAQTLVEEAAYVQEGEESYTIYFDEDWNRLENGENGYHAAAQVKSQGNEGLLHMEVTILGPKGQELYSLSSDRDFS